MLLRNVTAFKRIVRNPAEGGALMFIPSVSRQDIDQKTGVGLTKVIQVLVGDDFVDREVPGFMHECAVEVLPKGTVEMRDGQGEAMLISPRWELAGKAKPKVHAAAAGGDGGDPT